MVPADPAPTDSPRPDPRPPHDPGAGSAHAHPTPTPTPAAASREAPWRPLPAAALRAWRLSSVVGALVPMVALAGPVFLLTVVRGELGAGAYVLAMLLIYLLLAGFGWWYSGLRWRHTGWRLEEDGLHLRRGAWWRSETRVPRSRVQHVDLNHGPLDRRFGLAALKVHTAGTRLASVQLGGMAHADAVQLRDALVLDPAVPAGQAEHAAAPVEAAGTSAGADPGDATPGAGLDGR